MSLYVTLPSNSSMNYFPNNTLQTFTVKLETNLDLQTDYEIALCEIMYPKNWNVNIGYFLIFINDKEIKVDLIVSDQSTYKKVTMEINQLLADSKITEKNVKVWYDQRTLKYQLEVNNCQVQINGTFCKLFGFSNNIIFKNTSATEKILDTTVLNIVNALYVYSDIVEHQYVGDTRVQLLRAVSTHDINNEYVDIIYDSPHYVPVIKRSINTIEINIFTDTGEKVLFQRGKLLIKLHFRPI